MSKKGFLCGPLDDAVVEHGVAYVARLIGISASTVRNLSYMSRERYPLWVKEPSGRTISLLASWLNVSTGTVVDRYCQKHIVEIEWS